jgi:hypothetical protein
MFDLFSEQENAMKIRKIDSSIDVANIGAQSVMSKSDIESLNKAYSCDGKVPTYGGGNFKVLYIVKKVKGKEVIYFLFCTCKA